MSRVLQRVIDWSVSHRVAVLVATAALCLAGVWATLRMPVDAIPDLSDVQVIVMTEWPGQAPELVEDQVTYPLSTELLKVPHAKVVRGMSQFGLSGVFVVFEDGTDLYWARSRVLEYLGGVRERLPAGAMPMLGPDATGVGWVMQYILADTTGRLDLAQLRSLQDWTVRPALSAVPGVAEIAALGGFEQQYQVEVDPTKLVAYGLSMSQVVAAVQASNRDVGGRTLEFGGTEYLVRGRGRFRTLDDLRGIALGAGATGAPVTVGDVANVQFGPELRRGIAELDGKGEIVTGWVVMRYGENPRDVIDGVKQKMAEVSRALPPGVTFLEGYDRSGLIDRAIATLREKLIEESIIVGLVTVLFLLHAPSALVAILTLPIGILIAFLAMRLLGLSANIMSLGGIAIAIGAMIDAAIVMVENLHKHMERDERDRGGRDRWTLVAESAREVGPALFVSLLLITVSFIPVFALEAQEGRLFEPLAWTKTLAMAAAALLAVTLVPVTMGLFIRGTIRAEEKHPVSRALMAGYRPVIAWVLRWPIPVIGGAAAILLLSLVPLRRIGSEFMPPLDEGTILFMPTTLPGIGVRKASELLQRQDSIIATVPEVASVFGKAGRANTATDPAGLDMAETTIVLRPEDEWRPGMTTDRIIAQLDSLLAFPGVTNSWTMPIRGRIDMLATGIRTPVGIKIFGPDLARLEEIGREIEGALRMVPGTRSVFAERAVSGYYVDIDIDRDAAARYGLNIDDVQDVIASAIGGMTITQTVEGRERYGVRVRYPHELRDRPEKLAEVLLPVYQGRGAAPAGGGMSGMGAGTGGAGGSTTQVPLGAIAEIRTVSGPMAIKTENAFPTAWVYVDVEGGDIGGYVADAQAMVADMVTLPEGYTLSWSGQFEYMERAQRRMMLVVPATLALILLLLYLNFRSVGETLIVMLSLPFALVGGVLLLWLLDYNWSVATAIGFIALAGVAAETGVIMLIYLDHAWDARRLAGRSTPADLHDAVMEGAVERVRPKMMTVVAIIAGLLPIMWGHGAGADIMKRIAAPMVGGMVSSTILTLVVIPAVYSLWREAGQRSVARDAMRLDSDARVAHRTDIVHST